jgi:pimeloyl-ACP methyl ester carboxylesterase
MTSLQKAGPSVVLVHGADADGASWSEVIKLLHGAGITVTGVQNPLISLADDVAHTRRVLTQQPVPVILAGHSFAGTVITETGTHPAVAALVYVAAPAPDAGEDYGALAGRFPVPPASTGLAYTGGFGALTEDAFLNDFANGVEPGLARMLYAVQGRVSDTSSQTGRRQRLGGHGQRGTRSPGRIGRPPPSCSGSWPGAWMRRPWRSRPATSLITHPGEVTQLVMNAVHAVRPSAALGGPA